MRKLLLLTLITAFSFSAKAQLSVNGGDSSMCVNDTLSYTASGMTILGWVDTLNQDTTTMATYEFTTSVVGTHTIWAVGINIFPADTDTIGIDITVNPNPTAAMMSSAGMTLCEGSSTELVGMPMGMATYTWGPAGLLDTTGGDTVIATPTADTTFTLMVTDTNGCMDMTSMMISVDSSPVVTINSTTSATNGFVCEGGSATLTAVANGVASYEWSPIATLNDSASMSVIATPTGNTTYTVIVTDSNGCTGSASILVRVNRNPPTIVFQPEEATICEGQSIFIDVLSTGNSYSWTPTTGVDNPTSQDVTLSPTTTTTYTLEAESDGCVRTDDITITVNPAPGLTLQQTAGDPSLCLDETAELTATCAVCVSYIWTLPNSVINSTNNVQTVSPNEPGTIPVIVRGLDDIGCGTSRTINLNVDDCFIGEPFPPAGIEDAEEASLTVLNQVDQVVFESTEVINCVSLFNLLGEEVAVAAGNSTQAVIAKNDLAGGIYIARLQLNSGEQIVRKLYLE